MLVERMRESLQAAGGWAALQPEQGRRRPDGGSRLEGLQRPAMAGLGRGGHIRAHYARVSATASNVCCLRSYSWVLRW